MKHIGEIFKNDLRGLHKNTLALIIAIGLCVLPSLYAWLNLHANWDPYANTGNIRILFANEDQPYTDPSGETWALGDEIAADLKTKTSIGWTFVDRAEKVTEGVRSGDYYAGIVIGEHFSEDVYNGSKTEETPSVNYYVNAKKNAVATKITDSATSSVQESLSHNYIKHISKKLYNDIREERDELSQDVKKMEDELDQSFDRLLKRIGGFEKMLDSLIGANGGLNSDLQDASSKLRSAKKTVKEHSGSIDQVEKKLTNTKTTLRTVSGELSGAMSSILVRIGDLQTSVQKISFGDKGKKIRKTLEKIETRLAQLGTVTDKLIKLAEKLSGTETLVGHLRELKTMEETLVKTIQFMLNTDLLEAVKDNISGALETLKNGLFSLSSTYTETVLPELNSLLDNLMRQARAMQDLLNSIGQILDSSESVLGRTGETLNTFDTSLAQLKRITTQLKSKLNRLKNETDQLNDDERISFLATLLSGDADAVAEYLSDPVVVETEEIYGVENYGSGVAPFYTVLAIWFGMTVLLALFKVVPSGSPFTSFKPHQQYFGKYILFFLISQIQTAIIVCGELFFFHIQCLHPGLFFLAAAVTSFAISILVFTLALSFGDLGKAICIIVMVLQIAGSGGTFPIEALPAFFRGIYVFFPFPYAINAMRECIGGMYDGTYEKNLLALGAFIAAALLIGLFVRLPFIKIFHFIEKRMEDTDMM